MIRRRAFKPTILKRFISHLEVQEMMDDNRVPADNRTEKRQYSLPESLLASWRQQQRGEVLAKFRDTAIVNVRSGDGGNGKISFLRESGRSVGPPDGGDGGSGGNVYIQTSNQLASLAYLRPTYNAANGKDGGSAQLNGKKGRDVIIQVPVGTVVRWAPSHIRRRDFKNNQEESSNSTEVDVVTSWSRFDSDVSIQLKRETFKDGNGGWLFRAKEEEKWEHNPQFQQICQRVKQFDLINRRSERISDLFPFKGLDLSNVTDNQPHLLLKGGSGGLGNMHFQTPQLRSPTFAKRGRSGCEMTLVLEMKMLADVGLVGLPNAGKSTLLGKISRASPKVGDYEFTTLVPSVGTVQLNVAGNKLTVADIPGLVKDAHLNKGLGLGFLRHIERCKGLALIIGLDREDPVKDAEVLLTELGTRANGKGMLVVATKADVEGAQEKYAALADYARGKGWGIIPCSAQSGSVEGVVSAMAETIVNEPKRE